MKAITIFLLICLAYRVGCAEIKDTQCVEENKNQVQWAREEIASIKKVFTMWSGDTRIEHGFGNQLTKVVSIERDKARDTLTANEINAIWAVRNNFRLNVKVRNDAAGIALAKFRTNHTTEDPAIKDGKSNENEIISFCFYNENMVALELDNFVTDVYSLMRDQTLKKGNKDDRLILLVSFQYRMYVMLQLLLNYLDLYKLFFTYESDFLEGSKIRTLYEVVTSNYIASKGHGSRTDTFVTKAREDLKNIAFASYLILSRKAFKEYNKWYEDCQVTRFEECVTQVFGIKNNESITIGDWQRYNYDHCTLSAKLQCNTELKQNVIKMMETNKNLDEKGDFKLDEDYDDLLIKTSGFWTPILKMIDSENHKDISIEDVLHEFYISIDKAINHLNTNNLAKKINVFKKIKNDFEKTMKERKCETNKKLIINCIKKEDEKTLREQNLIFLFEPTETEYKNFMKVIASKKKLRILEEEIGNNKQALISSEAENTSILKSSLASVARLIPDFKGLII